MARKELADHLLSVRFTILLLIMAMALVAAAYAAAGGIRQVAATSSDFPALFLKLFAVAPERSRIPPFFALVALLGPLFGIAFGFDSVNGERAQGTLPRLLSQPIYRDDVINGKFAAGLAAISLALGGLVLLVAGVGMVRIGVVPTPAEVVRLAFYLTLAVIYSGFWLALSILFSVLLRRAATSALAAIAVWLVATIFGGLLVGVVADVLAPVPPDATPEEVLRNDRYGRNLGRIFPGRLYSDATLVLLNPELRTLELLGALLLEAEPRAVSAPLSLEQSLLLVWPQMTLIVAMTVVCFAAAYVAFMRQEVRA